MDMLVFAFIFGIVILFLIGFTKNEHDNKDFQIRLKSGALVKGQARGQGYKEKKQVSDEERIAALKVTLNIIDQAKLAQEAIKSFKVDEFISVVELLDSHQDIIEALDIYHSELRSVYVDLLKPFSSKYNITKAKYFDAQLSVDVLACMRVGKSQILKLPQVASVFRVEDSVVGKQIKISKLHSWDDIKDRF